jgi:hypothetical protein
MNYIYQADPAVRELAKEMYVRRYKRYSLLTRLSSFLSQVLP